MINQYPAWKYIIIGVILIIGFVYALPNIYGDNPSVQITSPARGAKIDLSVADDVEALLKRNNIGYKSISFENNAMVLVRFKNTEIQLQAKDLIKNEFDTLKKKFTVALNLTPATPGWLTSMNALPMYLGLDLRGGVHLLIEVDMDAALGQAIERYTQDLKTLLRKNKVRSVLFEQISPLNDKPGAVEMRFRDTDSRIKAYGVIAKEYPDLKLSEVDNSNEIVLLASMKESEVREIRRFALKQNITTLRSRVNELGVAEPVIQQQGEKRIIVQLPGVQDTGRVKEILGATATLEYRLVDTEHDVQSAVDGRVPAGSLLYYERDGSPILLKRGVIVRGDQVTDAASGIDQQTGSPAVFVTLDGKGAKKMGKITKDNIGKPMAVVFIEKIVETKTIGGKAVKKKKDVQEVINVATIRDVFSKRFQTTGLDSTAEARNLALLLRAGALAAPIEIVEERTIGPSLGQESIDQGQKSVIIGFVAVLGFMVFWYRAFGVVANLALGFNLVLIIAVLSMLQATLTLPGIAGIVLTVGMAVDANVLIFERIREELRNRNTPQASIHSGYEKAFSTIADANITTLIAALVLFGFGTGPVKGFAITLSIGIITSMFTAIMVTRGVVNVAYGRRKVTRLSI